MFAMCWSEQIEVQAWCHTKITLCCLMCVVWRGCKLPFHCGTLSYNDKYMNLLPHLHKHSLQQHHFTQLGRYWCFIYSHKITNQHKKMYQTKTASRLHWWYHWIFGDGNWEGNMQKTSRPPTAYHSVSDRCLSLLLSAALYFMRSEEVCFIETAALTDLKPHKYFTRDLIKLSFKTQDKAGGLSLSLFFTPIEWFRFSSMFSSCGTGSSRTDKIKFS